MNGAGQPITKQTRARMDAPQPTCHTSTSSSWGVSKVFKKLLTVSEFCEHVISEEREAEACESAKGYNSRDSAGSVNGIIVDLSGTIR